MTADRKIGNIPIFNFDQGEMVERAYWRTCLNCDHYHRDSDTCQLANARPPAEVILHGCEMWIREVPF